MGLLALTFFVVVAVMAIMAIGQRFTNRCLRGSCGGPDVLDAQGDVVSCDTCPLRQSDKNPVPTETP